jgi:hypothetical protein
MATDATRADQPAGGRGLAWIGLLLTVAGVVGYFVVVFRLAAWLPSVRNEAVPNWMLIGAGLLLAIVAVRRSSGWTVKVLLGVDLVLAGLFAAMLYVMPVVPGASGPTIGAPAPGFAMLDQNGTTVRLAALRDAPFLLVFYRGHW